MRKQRDRIYSVWSQMLQRCGNPNHKQYADYGGRGIFVCARWKGFRAFETDMGPRPDGDYSIERKDNNGGYEPSNCRWATRKEQNSNKRNCIYVVMHQGKRLTLREYCRIYNLNYRPIVKRIQDRSWPIELALQIPIGGKNQNDVLALWNQTQELREYLKVALDAAEGRPTVERLLLEARRACDDIPDVRFAA